MMDNIHNISFPLKTKADLSPLIERSGDAKAVLIGEASHGTSEFYSWRAEITKRLIEEKGFQFIAVEGDWPQCYEVNRFVKDPDASGISARKALNVFRRWPTWMWANAEVLEFIEWLADYNKQLPRERRVGFYGLDVYSLWESLGIAVNYLKDTLPQATQVARRAFRCFEPYRHNMQAYARESLDIPDACEDEIVKLLSTLEHLPPTNDKDSAEAKFNAEQNALVAVNAERYYRVMLQASAESWNLRDEHMAQTFYRLLDFYGKGLKPKGIIWAHNTHVGDAWATDMRELDEISVGQVLREGLEPGDTYIIGFSSYEGEVIAADDWDEPYKKMPLPPAIHDSWEHVLHNLGQNDRILIFSEDNEASKVFSDWKGQRAVGVVYEPRAEFGNYVPTVLRERYDALIHIDKTTALKPLGVEPKAEGPPDTFPASA